MQFLVEFAGMREAWDAGDRSLFQGWDRRAREQVEAVTA
jgi:hypothetical protein